MHYAMQRWITQLASSCKLLHGSPTFPRYRSSLIRREKWQDTLLNGWWETSHNICNSWIKNLEISPNLQIGNNAINALFFHDRLLRRQLGRATGPLTYWSMPLVSFRSQMCYNQVCASPLSTMLQLELILLIGYEFSEISLRSSYVTETTLSKVQKSSLLLAYEVNAVGPILVIKV